VHGKLRIGELGLMAGLAISGLILLLVAPLAGQTIIIDAGGAGDTGYSSPAGYPTVAYAIPSPIPLPILPPGTNDLTMRYGQSFAYDIQLPQPGPYTIVLEFIEPTIQAAGQRVFSVWANDQPIVDHLDLYASAGYLVPTTRAATIFAPSTRLHLSFVASVRNAVVSAIQVSWGTAGVCPMAAGPSGALAVNCVVTPWTIDVTGAVQLKP
jgi:hypothetical protein